MNAPVLYVIYRTLTCALLPLAVLFGGCSNQNTGGDQMPYKGITQTIQEAKGTDDPALDSLSAAIAERGYKEVNEVLQLTRVDVSATRQKASAVLLRLGLLGLNPLLDSLSTQKPDDYVWEMRSAVEVHLSTRARLVALLQEMLKDTRPQTPPNPFASREERPPTRRVCDDAYLLLRQLLALDESDDDRFLNQNAFLKMDDAERDAEIKRFQKSGRWTNLLETDSAR